MSLFAEANNSNQTKLKQIKGRPYVMHCSRVALGKHGERKRETRGDHMKPRDHVYILWGIACGGSLDHP